MVRSASSRVSNHEAPTFNPKLFLTPSSFHHDVIRIVAAVVNMHRMSS